MSDNPEKSGIAIDSFRVNECCPYRKSNRALVGTEACRKSSVQAICRLGVNKNGRGIPTVSAVCMFRKLLLQILGREGEHRTSVETPGKVQALAFAILEIFDLDDVLSLCQFSDAHLLHICV